MMTTGRSFIAAFTACFILAVFPVPAFSSYDSQAARRYAVACERLSDLRKSVNKKKYRSYWIDCIRTFELVEKKYPKSPSAPEACFDRAGIYFELYQFNKYWRDLDGSIRTYEKCQTVYPRHERAPEALYRVIELSLAHKKQGSSPASKAFAKLSEAYPRSPWLDRARTRLEMSRLNKKQEPKIAKRQVPVISSGKPRQRSVVQGIRHWSGGAYTRIVIDQNRQVKFEPYELKNPDRLVFDLLNSQVGDAVVKEPLPINDGILKQVRVSQYSADTVRVVLDLASIKSYAAFPLHDPERLVIDVSGIEDRAGEDTHQVSAETGTGQTGAGGMEGRIGAGQATSENIADPKLSISRQLGLKVKTIAIDAGHGGQDPGAIGRNGLKEKKVTLDIAKRLAVLIKERIGCNVVMTRDKDVFIPLEERPAIARTKGADLFVSIHVNANRKSKARGIETYIQGLRASDRDAMATAARENATTSKTLGELDDELTRILKGLRMESNDEDSIHLAHAVQGSLVDAMKPIQGTVVDLGVKRAFFYVLINTGMPSILAEVGFISNPTEEKLLNKDSYRQSIAEALYEGVRKYVESRNPRTAGI